MHPKSITFAFQNISVSDFNQTKKKESFSVRVNFGFLYISAPKHMIFRILVLTPLSIYKLWGVGKRILKIRCSGAKKWQKLKLAICIFVPHPLALGWQGTYNKSKFSVFSYWLQIVTSVVHVTRDQQYLDSKIEIKPKLWLGRATFERNRHTPGHHVFFSEIFELIN